MRCRLLPLVAILALPGFATADDVSIAVGKDAIEFKVGSTVVAKYATVNSVAKPYLYPVLAPNGVGVTRAWPVEKGLPGEATRDHPHQKSVWFCHGNVIPEGIELKVKSLTEGDKCVDFWSEAVKDGIARHGTIACVKVEKPVQHGKNHASVETLNEWRTPDGVKIMDEVRTIHFIDTKEGRLFAFDIVLKATVCPITFGDTKEGSFGIRVHDGLRPKEKTGATVTTADGKTVTPPAVEAPNLPIWGYPTAWIDYSGKLDDKEVGIAVFDHPKNPPASWHVRAYGLNAANPFGRAHSGFPSQKGKEDLLKIAKGGELKLKYAVYAHTGDAKTGKVAEAFAEFKK